MKNFIGLIIVVLTTLLTVFYKRLKKKKSRYEKVNIPGKYYNTVSLKEMAEEYGNNLERKMDDNEHPEDDAIPGAKVDWDNDEYKGKQVENSELIYSPYLSIRNIKNIEKEFLSEEEDNAL